ncbi:MAG: VOC family protein [Gammaproteobacteria bacterium]|nr:MAG: VOC family protein [Gammaproteobacteria bacterium]
MISGFHHAALSTPDLDRCIEFYTGVIGCEVAWTFAWPQGSRAADEVTGLADSAARAAMLRLGSSFLEVFEFSSPIPRAVHADRPACDHGISHICLEVVDIHQEYERLRAAGMRFHCPPQSQDTGWVTYGRDCDGNIVELLEFAVPAHDVD